MRKEDLLERDFQTVTELSGAPVSQEQIERLVNRYVWAATMCADKHVVEVACGCGSGLGVLGKSAASLVAGDLSAQILQKARAHYGGRVELTEFDAQRMPYADHSKDVVILFEAIYYLPAAEKFVDEARRILRPGGKVLIAT